MVSGCIFSLRLHHCYHFHSMLIIRPYCSLQLPNLLVFLMTSMDFTIVRIFNTIIAFVRSLILYYEAFLKLFLPLASSVHFLLTIISHVSKLKNLCPPLILLGPKLFLLLSLTAPAHHHVLVHMHQKAT